ncbi:MAG TPA: HD-GYP domain-containing protein [Pseudohaliea sp.]|nr:HD-GYP domain-containing protein [Pseudohaliea sp.]
MNVYEDEPGATVRALYQTIAALSAAIEFRDPYTVEHQSGVGTLCRAVGEMLGLSAAQQHALRMAAMLHDIGKIAVPTDILNKPRALTEEERGLVRTHPEAGYAILANVDFPWPVADIVLQHHERYDGSGYPAGLAGEAIMLEARILAVADTCDSMLVDRPYRKGLPLAQVLLELEQHSGTTLDPVVCEAMTTLLTSRIDSFRNFAPEVQRQPVVQTLLRHSGFTSASTTVAE